MEDREGHIWMDGGLVAWREAKVHVLTHTLHYGLGVFEGIRAYQTDSGTAIFRLDSHIERLFRSAQILNFPMPFDRATLHGACRQVIQSNGLSSGYIRPMCFYGAESMGLRADRLTSHAMVAAWPWDTYLGQEALQNGIRIKTSSYARPHARSTPSRAKANGNYINSMLALQEARSCGYDEALLLDTDGFVAEGSGENIFIVRDGQLLTPDLGSALEGITRDTVMQLATTRGLVVREKRITRDEVYIADEAFFTGTAAELTPIREVDEHRIGHGEPGELTRQLQEDFFACVTGRQTPQADWLSHVQDNADA